MLGIVGISVDYISLVVEVVERYIIACGLPVLCGKGDSRVAAQVAE